MIDEIKKVQEVDPNLRMISGEDNGSLYESFAYKQGLLYFKDRIYVPKEAKLRDEILEEAHTSKLNIHPGSEKMYKDLKTHF